MSRLIVDASVLGPLVIPDEAGNLLPEVLLALTAGNALVPQHWRLEVANLGRMAVRRGRLTESSMKTVFADLSELPIEIDADTDRNAWGRTISLSARYDLTAYDAAYLELATRTGHPLATSDGKLKRAALAESVSLIAI